MGETGIAPTIKAIPTSYNGYQFRSRLEARWAVFFDVLGIEYRYETEGLDVNGTWYLPDFWLPQYDVWIEVKGVLDGDAFRKAEELARMHRAVLILTGLDKRGSILCYDIGDSSAGFYMGGDCDFCVCGSCGRIQIAPYDYRHRTHYKDEPLDEMLYCSCLFALYDHPAISGARQAARSARFGT